MCNIDLSINFTLFYFSLLYFVHISQYKFSIFYCVQDPLQEASSSTNAGDGKMDVSIKYNIIM